MKNKNNRIKQIISPISAGQVLRTRAEKIFREKAAYEPENIEALPPDEIRRMLSELRVHQIELEMQNEELLQSQVELDAVRARYFDLYDLAPVGYCTVNEQGQILEANFTAAILLGVVPGELVEKLFTRFVFSDDQESYSLYQKQLFDSFPAGSSQVISGKSGESRGCELRMVKKDGTQLWMLLKATVVQSGNGARVCRIVMSDISECKRVEESLRVKAQIIDAAIDSVFIHDLDGNILYVNESAAKTRGYTRDEMVGMNLRQLDMPGFVSLSPMRIKELVETGQARFDSIHRCKDGALKPTAIQVQLIEYQGAPAVFGTVRDIIECSKVEEALRESEEKHRALVAGLPDIVMRFDRNERHLFVSENVRDVVDFPVEQFIGKTPRELGFPEVQCEFWEAAIRRVFDSGALFETEFTIDGKHGPVIYSWRFLPERDAQGAIRSILSFSRDVTAHRRAEQDYQMLFSEMVNGFALQEIICDGQGNPSDYRFLAVNPAFERMTGLKAVDLVGRTILEAFPGTEQYWAESYGTVARTGESASFENYFVALKKYFHVTAFRSSSNQLACIFADITERKRTEDALQQSMRFVQSSQEKYEQTVAMISDVIWRYEVDAHGQLVSSYISPVAERLLGLPDGTFNNNFEKYFSYVHPDDRTAMREMFLSGLRLRKKSVDGEYRLIKPDGTIIWQYSKGSVYAGDNGGAVGIGSTMDITERKLAEKKMQDSLKEKEVLLKEINHRVKNNLQIINSLYNLQATKIQDEKVKGFFKEGEARVKAIALVHEKLCESQDMVNINMEGYVKSLAASIRKLLCAGDRRITVHTSVDSCICMGVDTILNCGLIINELMTNAYKHAFPDGREGKISIGLHRNSAGDYELTVSDNGVGMPSGFVIGTAQTLGLEMVSSLAHQMGAVHYKVKNGTEVKVTIKKYEKTS